MFFFLLDLIVVNMYIIYLHCFHNVSKEQGFKKLPMIHLQFKLGLCEALLLRWEVGDPIPCDMAPNERSVICTPLYSKIRKSCVICHVARPHFLGYKCNSNGCA